MGLRRKRSYLWTYFSVVGKNVASCNLCKLELSFKSTISNLRKHLLRKHPEVNHPESESKVSPGSPVSFKLQIIKPTLGSAEENSPIPQDVSHFVDDSPEATSYSDENEPDSPPQQKSKRSQMKASHMNSSCTNLLEKSKKNNVSHARISEIIRVVAEAPERSRVEEVDEHQAVGPNSPPQQQSSSSQMKTSHINSSCSNLQEKSKKNNARIPGIIRVVAEASGRSGVKKADEHQDVGTESSTEVFLCSSPLAVRPTSPTNTKLQSLSNNNNFSHDSFAEVITVVDETSGRSGVKELNEYQAVGLSISAKLQRMDPLQAIYAESLISQILCRGLLKMLKSANISEIIE